MDRVKENLFNILGQAYVLDAVWLDLFGGTGQVGIEALSRGASDVVFLDTVQAAIQTMHANLETTHLADNAQVIRMDAFAYLRQTTKPFDVIFIAPPQYKRMWVDAMTIIDGRTEALLQPDGIVVVQIDPKEDEALTLQQLTLFDQRTYGNTLLAFYEPA
jgi:16S rRNA (guanine(966)-N(2))-methyltransferase RsmD